MRVFGIAVALVWAGLGFSSPQAFAAPQKISLSDVTAKVSRENYLVLENAHRVYQAKESISYARGKLLPRLNLWRIANIPLGWSSLSDVVEDLAPFLVPANWFRVEEQTLLHWVQKESYRALWANELMTARILYLQTLLDESLLGHVREQQAALEALFLLVQTRETLGGVFQGASREIEIGLLGLQEDERALQSLIAQEKSELTYVMGFEASIEVELEPVVLPDLEALKPLFGEEFEYRALDTAPEVRQFEHLIQVSDWVERESKFSVFGISSATRGVAGGVFDELPVQEGWGLGTAPSIQIVRSQKEIFKLQARGVRETIKRQLKLLVSNYNLDLRNYPGLKRRVELTHSAQHQLDERLRLGESVDAADLVEASRRRIEADTAFFGVQYRFLMNQERLARLIFHGDYNKEPAVIEALEGSGSRP